MEPIWILALGMLVATLLLGGGYAEGRRSRGAEADERDQRQRARLAAFAEQIQELLEQGPDGVKAAHLVVASERRLSAADGVSDPSSRHDRMLSGAVDGDPGETSPPGGSAEGPSA